MTAVIFGEPPLPPAGTTAAIGPQDSGVTIGMVISISFAQASYDFHEGTVKVRWEKQDGQVVICIEMPPIANGVVLFAGQEYTLQTGTQEFCFPMA